MIIGISFRKFQRFRLKEHKYSFKIVVLFAYDNWANVNLTNFRPLQKSIR